MYILIWKTFDPQGKIFHLSLVMLLNSPWSRLHRRCHVPCKDIRGLKIWVFSEDALCPAKVFGNISRCCHGMRLDN